MPKYTFVTNPVISMHIDVEAANLEEALHDAEMASVQSLCYHCARGEEGSWNTSGELDADPSSSELVDAQCGEEDVTLQAQELWYQPAPRPPAPAPASSFRMTALMAIRRELVDAEHETPDGAPLFAPHQLAYIAEKLAIVVGDSLDDPGTRSVFMAELWKHAGWR